MFPANAAFITLQAAAAGPIIPPPHWPTFLTTAPGADNSAVKKRGNVNSSHQCRSSEVAVLQDYNNLSTIQTRAISKRQFQFM